MPQRYPIAVGKFPLTSEWSVWLPFEFAHRVEDGSIVLWRPGLTFYFDIRGNQFHDTIDQRLSWIRAVASDVRTSEQVSNELDLVRLTYEVDERATDPTKPHYRSLSAFIITDGGHVQIVAYCDDPQALGLAYSLIASVRPRALE
jgi:hypothetical protein